MGGQFIHSALMVLILSGIDGQGMELRTRLVTMVDVTRSDT
jgi:hypothetical protein